MNFGTSILIPESGAASEHMHMLGACVFILRVAVVLCNYPHPRVCLFWDFELIMLVRACAKNAARFFKAFRQATKGEVGEKGGERGGGGQRLVESNF